MGARLVVPPHEEGPAGGETRADETFDPSQLTKPFESTTATTNVGIVACPSNIKIVDTLQRTAFIVFFVFCHPTSNVQQ